RMQIAVVGMQLMALGMSTLRIVAAVQGGGVPGAQSSILKIKGSVIRQAISHLMRGVLGVHALPFAEEELDYAFAGELLHTDYSAAPAGQYFNLRKLSIYGGSNEIQKNIIAKMILEL
ncbi:acyl-CoA dehydrogenase family protein, partial [Pseudomonas fluorescens]|uniref:acyl-CoA dehydrogenase family protein n=1 Tax=Pseudomonas fluorescens TaxID=294 RepID=UPI0021E51BD6